MARITRLLKFLRLPVSGCSRLACSDLWHHYQCFDATAMLLSCISPCIGKPFLPVWVHCNAIKSKHKGLGPHEVGRAAPVEGEQETPPSQSDRVSRAIPSRGAQGGNRSSWPWRRASRAPRTMSWPSASWAAWWPVRRSDAALVVCWKKGDLTHALPEPRRTRASASGEAMTALLPGGTPHLSYQITVVRLRIR